MAFKIKYFLYAEKNSSKRFVCVITFFCFAEGRPEVSSFNPVICSF